MVVQGTPVAHLQHLQRLLHSIDKVFWPINELNDPIQNHVPLVKKLHKGDAYLDRHKLVLGWLIDTFKGTLELPPHMKLQINEIFEYLQPRSRVGTNVWHKILGELRSMLISSPGSQGLFSMLQEGLKYQDQDQICLTALMKDQLDDFKYLAKDLSQ
jgi:hypothetical protein